MVKLAKGLVIDHRYELQELIGEGGFGVVYRAVQLSTKQTVAIKFLLQDKIGNDYEAWSEKKRFLREMKAIAQIKHPNIVRLIDTGSLSEHQVYIVIEYVEGDTLHSVVNREGALGSDEALHIMMQVLDALACAHRQGIIHRDLKPQNIMVVPGGLLRNAMVLDFGIVGVLAQARDSSYVSLTSNSEIRGTPSYIAPEQLRRSLLTPQSDIYAWGLVFIELLSGTRAVSGESSFEIALRQADENPIPVPASIEDPGLRRVLARAIEKPLERRYQSADELLADLRALSKSSVPSLPISTPVPSSTSRKPLGLAVALLLVFVVVSFVVYQNAQHPRRQSPPSPAAPPVAARPGCSQHAQCEAEQRCSAAGQCVTALGEQCSELEGPLHGDADVLVAAIGTFADPSQRARLNAMRLAVREINEYGGVGAGRKLSLLLCDEKGDRDHAAKLAAFVASELEVAAILGPQQSSSFIDVANGVALPMEVMLLSPSATSSVVDVLGGEGLLWRTVDSDARSIPAISSRMAEQPELRTLLLARQGVYGSAFLEQLAAAMLASGLPKPMVHSYSDKLDSAEALERSLGELKWQGLERVVLISGSESAEVIAFVEERCQTVACAPYYILSEAGRRPEILALLDTVPALASRLEVVGAVDQNGVVFERFTLRYEAVWGPLAAASKVANAYDAVYVLGLALGTHTGEVLRGRALGQAIARLGSGERTEVGPSQFLGALRRLEKGESVDLVGASGELDFAHDSGSVQNPIARYRGTLTNAGHGFVIEAFFEQQAWKIVGSAPDALQPTSLAPDAPVETKPVETKPVETKPSVEKKPPVEKKPVEQQPEQQLQIQIPD